MRFSFDWLKRHLKTDKSIKEIADILTFLGLEVENFVDPSEVFKDFFVAQISDVEKHPNADKLRVCKATIFDGSIRKVVCGASNLRNGMRTILAIPGAKIPESGAVLKHSKIRGIPSDGMLCSYEELGLDSKLDGIVDLPDSVELLQRVESVLGIGGGILDIAVTPNRGDCFCVRGIARDLAASGAGELIENEDCYVSDESDFSMDISIDEYAYRAMPFVAFQTINGIANSKTQTWLTDLLTSAGVNSISQLIDLANFMTLDQCRPFHIYDLNKIEKSLSIKFANNRRKFVDLKGKEYNLTSDILIMKDSKNPLCILGVMGGNTCACDENTTDVLIEAAVFERAYIAKTGSKLNIISDSRTRFERGVDPDYVINGLNKLTKMILDSCGGKASKIKTFGNIPNNKKEITLSKQKLDSISGSDILFDHAVSILKNLDLKVISHSDDLAKFETPSFRADLEIEQDLIEEVLRISGYHNIQSVALPQKTVGNDKNLEMYKKIIHLKRIACSCGLSELLSFSFINNSNAEMFVSELSPSSCQIVSIANPISADLSVMRNSLFPNLLSNVSDSLRYSNKYCHIFELGPVFWLPSNQRLMISAIRAGKYSDRSWIGTNRDIDVFDVKSDLYTCLLSIGIDTDKIRLDTKIVPGWYHPARSAAVTINKKVIGYFGEMHPKIKKAFDIQVPIAGFEVYVDDLLTINSIESKKLMKKIYQSVERDFSFIFHPLHGNKIHAEDIINIVKKVDPLIKNINAFDYYKIDNSSIAIGISVLIQSDVDTLTDYKIKDISERIIEAAMSVGCEMRQ